jgi:5-(carboxyamino)imidazole ribonucleotide mutase
MPKGIPVATLAIGEAGAANAALSVVAMLAVYDEAIKDKLKKFRASQAEKVRNAKLPELS